MKIIYLISIPVVLKTSSLIINSLASRVVILLAEALKDNI